MNKLVEQFIAGDFEYTDRCQKHYKDNERRNYTREQLVRAMVRIRNKTIEYGKILESKGNNTFRLYGNPGLYNYSKNGFRTTYARQYFTYFDPKLDMFKRSNISEPVDDFIDPFERIKLTERIRSKSYQDYVKEQKIVTANAAPAGAIPKYTKGDNAGYRFKVETRQIRQLKGRRDNINAIDKHKMYETEAGFIKEAKKGQKMRKGERFL